MYAPLGLNELLTTIFFFFPTLKDNELKKVNMGEGFKYIFILILHLTFFKI